jgi:hypothetical protein
MEEKRSLKLMPEVLPAPSRRAWSGDARTRTLAHMKRLLAIAATSAAVGACKDKGYAVVDPIPPPAVCPGAPPHIKAAAARVDGGTDIAVRLAADTGPEKVHYAGSAPMSEHATVVSFSPPGDTLEIMLRPTGDATFVTARVQGECDGQPFSILVVVDIPDAGSGDALTVTLSTS